ncbi:hypothetical protein SZ25_00302, partial [Candidatus Arcanobacter lacustris]
MYRGFEGTLLSWSEAAIKKEILKDLREAELQNNKQKFLNISQKKVIEDKANDIMELRKKSFELLKTSILNGTEVLQFDRLQILNKMANVLDKKHKFQMLDKTSTKDEFAKQIKFAEVAISKQIRGFAAKDEKSTSRVKEIGISLRQNSTNNETAQYNKNERTANRIAHNEGKKFEDMFAKEGEREKEHQEIADYNKKSTIEKLGSSFMNGFSSSWSAIDKVTGLEQGVKNSLN